MSGTGRARHSSPLSSLWPTCSQPQGYVVCPAHRAWCQRPTLHRPDSSLFSEPLLPLQRELLRGRPDGAAGPHGDPVPPGVPMKHSGEGLRKGHVVCARCPRRRVPLRKGFHVGPCDLVCGEGLSWLWFLSLSLPFKIRWEKSRGGSEFERIPVAGEQGYAVLAGVQWTHMYQLNWKQTGLLGSSNRHYFPSARLGGGVG